MKSYGTNWITKVIFLCCCLVTTTCLAQQSVAFRCDFDNNHINGNGEGKIVAGYSGTKSLLIERNQPGTISRTFEIDPAKLAGQYVSLKTTVKAEGVSNPPNPWNGVKVMLVLDTGEGIQYPQIKLPVGSFGWTECTEPYIVPKRLKTAKLVVGLELVSGRAWFDNIEILVGRPKRKGPQFETKFMGHDLPRLRGVMHGPNFVEKDIVNLAENWKANHIRWQLNWVPMKQAEEWAKDMPNFDKWLDSALIECDKALDLCEKYNIRVLVDLHTPPGGRKEGGVCRMFSEKKYQDKFLSVWDKIARRYKGRDVVYAYDLLNETVEGTVAPGLMDWRQLATEATKVIRKIDPNKPVVFEPSPWGGPNGFDKLEPLDIGRVIYSFHMYKPFDFTHQGVQNKATGITYPGLISGEQWNKERLREEMTGVIDFQKYHNVQIYVGEFSAVRWAPGDSGVKYLQDVTSLFEELGWDWAYHAYREWDGWSVEHGPDPNNHQPTDKPTARKELLLEMFAKNKK